MAERVDKFPTPLLSPRVPWARYADGGQYRLTQGVDFDQDPDRARKAFINWALRNGYRGREHTSVRGNQLWVWVEKKPTSRRRKRTVKE